MTSNNRFAPFQFWPGIRMMQVPISSYFGSAAVALKLFRQRALAVLGIAVVLGACSSEPQITRMQELPESADAPYQKFLVIALYSKFDNRRYFEEEVVMQLSELGTEAIASTSMMDTRTPVTRETFMAMVEDINADAVIVTQMASLQTAGTVVSMNPQATYNLRPTGYYNVFSVDLQEYKEPKAVNYEYSLALVTDVFSVRALETVWGIQSESKVDVAFDRVGDFSILRNEVAAITRYLSRDGVIAR
jgi:hypothetical protein